MVFGNDQKKNPYHKKKREDNLMNSHSLLKLDIYHVIFCRGQRHN